MTDDELVRRLRVAASNICPVSPDGGGTIFAALPEAHRRFLLSMNGLTVYSGGYRLFGSRPEPFLDLAAWNDQDSWRFAWGQLAEDFVFIGETSFGDQYAYRCLRCHPPMQLSAAVYYIDGNTFQSFEVAPDFETFLRNEILGNSYHPADQTMIEAIRTLGPIEPKDHHVYTPSLLIGGSESVESIMTMPAFTAMTIAGDIASWVSSATEGVRVLGVEPWFDERGRGRLRVVAD